jgi:glyoxylase-like metal-dependent hydrolase (beta-lactamase superfamily II)
MSTEVRQVSASITCLQRTSYLTCSYIVRTRGGLVLVDAGMDSAGADIHVGLRALEAHVDEIRAILLTHWHNDHAAGAQAIHAPSGHRWTAITATNRTSRAERARPGHAGGSVTAFRN